MKISCIFLMIAISISSFFTSCKGQKTFGTQFLSLQQVITLPGVNGRIDHLSVDKAHKVMYMSALGNNTLEVIDLSTGKVIHTIKGLREPQGVAYLPQTNSIFVANGGNGRCIFYDANTYKTRGVLNFHNDADDVRYSPEDQTVYVGYGTGGIALINAASMKTIGTIRLPGHPEGFQMDTKTKKIWVNVPDDRSIMVLDGKNKKVVAQWRINDPSAYFPMAYDSKDRRLFIGCRRPSRLLVLDSETGKKIASIPCVGDADDLYFDTASKRILISGGRGYIDIFKQKDANNYSQIAHISSRSGARTSLWVPEWKELLLAAPARNGRPAAVLVYKMNG